MRNFLSIKKRIFNQNESGFSLVESIFVLTISSILLVIAVPKLEIPVRKSIDGIKNYSKKEIRMTLCHSYGFHLIHKNILVEATHIVLINSFNNFLPLSNKRNFILRSLKRMETKIIKDETKDMLKEFMHRSFMPNHMNNSFKNVFYKSLESLNKTLLLSDLKQLYINRDFPVFLRKDCKIIFIKSENDLILDNESNNNFLDSLNKTLERKPILIKLSQQGHCLKNLNLYEILLNTLND